MPAYHKTEVSEMGKKRHFLSGFGKISSSRESLSGREGNEIKKKGAGKGGALQGRQGRSGRGCMFFAFLLLRVL
jgi:hypothetical protein